MVLQLFDVELASIVAVAGACADVEQDVPSYGADLGLVLVLPGVLPTKGSRIRCPSSC